RRNVPEGGLGSGVRPFAERVIVIYRDRTKAQEQGDGRRDERGGRRRRAMVHGRGHPGRGRGRMRRGDIRTAVLAVLSEGPGHGYDVIQRLEDKTEGSWRPGPGAGAPRA